jgi:acyl-CoA synthetase (AMP-forming)/AMP-acid ligase II/acyl carrier protein
MVRRLNQLGIGRGDRVAIVLPNGPEMALAMLCVASGAAAAPLNPAYRSAEFEFYLKDLAPKAVIVAQGQDSPARAVAASQGVPVLDLAGAADVRDCAFALNGLPRGTAVDTGFANTDDPALLLHTSGTTSRPKLVVLTHANLCASARNIAASMALGPNDRCLNVMPLFHIHGLIGALLSSLAAGASVACTPGFHAARFLEWMDEFRPTWYTAVPTMHQALLAEAGSHPDVIARCPLRFIRSCSSALPLRVLAEVEATFRAPVIEAYGMTEASHQMTINPLPPRARKPGSVGLPAGVSVAILDAAGNLVASPVTGEVAIRGASVTAGYANNPAANADAFTNGWFRTGDLGYLDQDGYLFLIGRVKEIINRGGEKISPREVDDVLLEHPSVEQAVTFGLPHPTLGQDVAAAIVLRPAKSVSEQELREFTAVRLAEFKVPRRIVFVNELPKGATGKPQRIGVAEKLGLLADGADRPSLSQAGFVAPSTPLQHTLATILRELLKVERIGIADDFFQLGGDSLLAAQAMTQIGEALSIDPAGLSLFETPTIEALSHRLERGQTVVAP